MLKSTSNWDTSKEAFYHGLSLGMLSYLDNDYYVTSNFEAGFTLTNIEDDTNGMGRLHEMNISTYIMTRAIK